MPNQPVIARRLLYAATLALPVCAFIAGCSSTSANPPLNPAAAKAAKSGNGPANDPLSLDPSGAQMSDAAIASRVKAALAAEPDLRALPVSVATYRGAVMLSGYVNSEVQIQKAVAITRGVPGVQSVNNDLLVKP